MSTLTNLQGVQHIDHLIKGGKSTHKYLYIDEELEDMSIFTEKGREEKVLYAIWRICTTLHFAFCVNLNDLNFVVSYFTYFPFCIFISLVRQIFEWKTAVWS